ncbi:MAG TPA: radical SAM protein [Xanthobacteraceae bacterium]
MPGLPAPPSADAPPPPSDASTIFKYILVKLAARCNIDCSYCYWFRDQAVYDMPKILPLEVEGQFLDKLRTHVTTHRLASFSVILHGGEPLLFGKPRLRALCAKLTALEEATGVEIRTSITTNGVLIDQEWAGLFKQFGIGVTLSLDGAEEQHDRRRVDHRGRGTYKKAVNALALLREVGIEPGILAVCDPEGEPAELCRAFVDTLGIKNFDVLIPDATHDDTVISIERYYTKLFDLWFDDYSRRGIGIRFIENMLRGTVGLRSTTEAIGYGPITTLTMLTDGSLEPLDVLRIAGHGATRTHYNVRAHQFQDVQGDATWREAQRSSLNLSAICRACEFRDACGGGYLPWRWSKDRRYDNPSVYCADLKAMFQHVWRRVSPTLYVQSTPGEAAAAGQSKGRAVSRVAHDQPKMHGSGTRAH